MLGENNTVELLIIAGAAFTIVGFLAIWKLEIVSYIYDVRLTADATYDADVRRHRGRLWADVQQAEGPSSAGPCQASRPP